MSNIQSRYRRVIPSLLELQDILGLDLTIFKKLMNNLHGKKVDYLIKALKIIEYKYRSMGMNKEDYDSFKSLVLSEIMINNPEYDLELVILKYIGYTYQDIKEVDYERTK